MVYKHMKNGKFDFFLHETCLKWKWARLPLETNSLMNEDANFINKTLGKKKELSAWSRQHRKSKKYLKQWSMLTMSFCHQRLLKFVCIWKSIWWLMWCKVNYISIQRFQLYFLLHYFYALIFYQKYNKSSCKYVFSI